jgi:hypothetical protein
LELGFDLVLDLETDLELEFELELELKLELGNRERILLQMQLMVAGRGCLLD